MENHIIQWNARGISSAKQELIKLIDSYQPLVITIQETFLGNDFSIKLPGYSNFCRQGHYNQRFHGGVAIYIHNSCPHDKLEINSEHQIIAATVQFNHHKPITIASIYIPGRERATYQSISEIVRQLPKPFLLLGDMNGHHATWGSLTNNHRGNLINNILSDFQLNCLNDGRSTHESGSCIDLSICDPSLTPFMEWNVLPSVLSSDHNPILSTIITRNADQPTAKSRYNIKKAKWFEYSIDDVWSETLPGIEESSCRSLVDDLYNRIYAATERNVP